MSKFGTASYTNISRRFTEYVSLDEKTPIEGTIVPPMGELSDTGTWAVWHACHWGYKIPRTDDPLKLFSQPFKCLLQKNNKKQSLWL